MSRHGFPVVVHVLLLRGGAEGDEVFLLRRAGTGFMDGYYVPPGGHLRTGESPTAAAARECREEAGAHPGRLRPLCVLPYRAGGKQGINLVFEGTGLSGEPGLGDPSSSDRAGWFPLRRQPQPVPSWLGQAFEMRGTGDWFRELGFAEVRQNPRKG